MTLSILFYLFAAWTICSFLTALVLRQSASLPPQPLPGSGMVLITPPGLTPAALLLLLQTRQEVITLIREEGIESIQQDALWTCPPTGMVVGRN